MPPSSTESNRRRRGLAPGLKPLLNAPLARLLVALLVTTAIGGIVAITASASLQEDLDGKQAALDQAKQKKGLLSSEIDRFNDKIERLTGEVAALRNREAAVQAELDRAQARLTEERRNLAIIRERLQRTIAALRERLVEIYKADEPSAVSIVLDSDGMDDVLGRYEYLQRIQSENADLVVDVRELRNDAEATVARVRGARDAIAAKEAELERTRLELEARESSLQAARRHSEQAWERVDGHVDKLEGDVSDIQGKIQEQLAAVSGVSELPAGPVRGASGGFIWPVSGTVVSPFGTRWGRLHAGIDIAVPAGTPIRAVQDGQIALLQSEAASGGYGNFTCIDHGGGLASCYAHQSSFAITSGSVSQGDVIGYVGCTGHCYGDHLHFEFRVNGSPVDPMGYL